MPSDELLLECVVTSTNEDGTTNIAPMGPIVDWPMTRALLRPFQTSQTFGNLVRERSCILHITDDVELIARAALGQIERQPKMEAIAGGQILVDACRWYALEVEEIDSSQPRSEIRCRVTAEGRLREFIGFNRAMHAVLEATILATRLHLLSPAEVKKQLQSLYPQVEKTGGSREHRAWQIVVDYVTAKKAES